MYNYRVDFSAESLRCDSEGPARLLRELRHTLQAFQMIPLGSARYRELRGTDGSTALWFNFQSEEIDRTLVTTALLKPYEWMPVQRPPWSDSDWKQLEP